ncbi:unnamed protein product [Orchesella dallaii]|uniref:DUF4806 domain-containing protein n=1 Tax=Orchesella dallaii TaxID=48710 RepID=A0ABP1PKR7_9HEXA
MYCIVEFKDEESVQLVPERWLNQNHTMCKWPKIPPTNLIKRDVKPDDSWDNFPVRVLRSKIENYTIGRQLEERATITSTLETTDNDTPLTKGKRFKREGKRGASRLKQPKAKRRLPIAKTSPKLGLVRSDSTDDSRGSSPSISEKIILSGSELGSIDDSGDERGGDVNQSLLDNTVPANLPATTFNVEQPPNCSVSRITTNDYQEIPSHYLPQASHVPPPGLYFGQNPSYNPSQRVNDSYYEPSANHHGMFPPAQIPHQQIFLPHFGSRFPQVAQQPYVSGIDNQPPFSFDATRQSVDQQREDSVNLEDSAYDNCTSCAHCRERQAAFEKKLLAIVGEIKVDVAEILSRNTSIGEAAQQRQLDSIPFSFPINNAKELQQFDDWLLRDQDNFESVVAYCASFGGKNLGKIVTTILKKLISPELAKQINFIGANQKIAFSNLKLCEAVLESTRRNHGQRSSTEESIFAAIQNWFRNARDLNGGRKSRSDAANLKRSRDVVPN